MHWQLCLAPPSQHTNTSVSHVWWPHPRLQHRAASDRMQLQPPRRTYAWCEVQVVVGELLELSLWHASWPQQLSVVRALSHCTSTSQASPPRNTLVALAVWLTFLPLCANIHRVAHTHTPTTTTQPHDLARLPRRPHPLRPLRPLESRRLELVSQLLQLLQLLCEAFRRVFPPRRQHRKYTLYRQLRPEW